MLNGQHCGTVAVGNKALGLLSEFDKNLLGPYLREIALPAGSVLCERGGKEEYIYLPHRGAVSMIAAILYLRCSQRRTTVTVKTSR